MFHCTKSDNDMENTATLQLPRGLSGPQRKRWLEAGGPPPDLRGEMRPRNTPNPLRAWLEQEPAPMSKAQFARLIGCSKSYVSMLLADGAPWPSRRLALRIAIVTEGVVTPNDLAGYPPDG
jgi:hypothetical protein